MEKMLIACALFSCLLVAINGGPIHASCQLTWSWNASCTDVNSKIVQQMIKWKGTDCDGEKCRYAIVSNSTSMIKGTHTTPVKHYVDDFSLQFSGACTVEGKSSSETWYAVLDSGTNYCNLRNLVNGADLDKAPGFKEDVSDSTCTQFSSADCGKY